MHDTKRNVVTSQLVTKKVAHTRLPSVGSRRWSRFLAVSLQVMWVINPAVDCHYFPPGLQLPPQPLRGCYQLFRCLVNRRTMGANTLPKTITRQRRGCKLNPGPSAPESSTLTTRLPSHLVTSCKHLRNRVTPCYLSSRYTSAASIHQANGHGLVTF